MRHHTNHPQYPLATAAANPRRTQLGAAAWISAACAAAIVLIALVVVALVDNPARGAADHAAVPSAKPGPPVPQKPTEYAPPLAELVPGDGTWLVGKEIKRGLYASQGGQWCYWSRRSDLSGEYEGLIQNSFGRNGPQKVALGPEDFAFTSNGCGQWVMVK